MNNKVIISDYTDRPLLVKPKDNWTIYTVYRDKDEAIKAVYYNYSSSFTTSSLIITDLEGKIGKGKLEDAGVYKNH